MTKSHVILPALFVVVFSLFASSTEVRAQAGSSDEHVVVSGETLYSIARQHGLTIAELQAANALSGSLIQPGQTLRLSGTASVAKSDRYTVRAGDTLWGIARQNNTTVASLRALNAISGSSLSIGQDLWLSADRLEDAAIANNSVTTPETVEGGEEGVDVAYQEVEVDEMRSADSGRAVGRQGVEKVAADVGSEAEMTADAAREAEETVPSEIAAGVKEATIQEASETAEADGATTDPVSSGGGIADPAESTADVVVTIDGTTEAESFDFHTVASGETWASLAHRYGADLSALRLVNDNQERLPAVGSQIRIPADPTVFHYRVEQGDTIERIAKWFTVKESVIRRINDLPDGRVTPGQTLRIPDLNSPLLDPNYKPLRNAAAGTSSSAGARQSNLPKSNDGMEEGDVVVIRVDTSKTKEVLAQRKRLEVEAADLAEAAADALAETKEAVDAPADRPKASKQSEGNRSDVRIYPESFRGRLMANGNAYNPKRSTISHPTIAFGQQVRVINLESGSSTFAIVADRPLPGSSQIDVSSSVASELGIRKTGDAQIMVESVK